MLRNVLDEYLTGIKRERDFDAPFIALLAAMGFEDIHLTHGTQEKGKDFIAKRDHHQWVFQSKKGDIATKEMQEAIGQLTVAAVTGLSHPSFSADLPRKIVFVTTGNINQHGNDLLASFSENLLKRLGMEPAEAWGKSRLIDLLLENGVEGLRSTRLVDIEAQGRFFTLYGAAVRKKIEIREIEEHSLTWLDLTLDEKELTLLGSVEAVVLSSKCADGGLLYEAWQCELAALRMAMFRLYGAEGERLAQLKMLCERQVDACVSAAQRFASDVWERWEARGRRLDLVVNSPSVFVTYPVHSLRMAEALAFVALSSSDESTTAGSKLSEFVSSEPGSARPISDRYAVSVVATVLALTKSGNVRLVRGFILAAASWILDRYENGFGLANVDASVQEEVDYLLGPSFAGLGTKPKLASLVASALVDLTAFLQEDALYSDLVNDYECVEIHPEYFQAPDNEAQFLIGHEDVVNYGGISFAPTLQADGTFHSPYGSAEPSYHLFDELPGAAYIGLALLLRDRYFPRLWSRLISVS